MKQIRMNEMAEEQKLQYAEPLKKRGIRLVRIMVAVPILQIVLWITISCTPFFERFSERTLDISTFVLLILEISMVLYLNKKREKTLRVYDEILEERIWIGCIENFRMNQDYEFVDKNEQTVFKKFTDQDYEKYAGKDNVYVIYIPRNDNWYIESGSVSS